MDGETVAELAKKKDPAAVKLGRKGGKEIAKRWTNDIKADRLSHNKMSVLLHSEGGSHSSLKG